MTFRFLVALALASLLTIGLFWSLRAMTQRTGEVALFQPLPKIDFLRLTHDSDLEEKKRVKPVISKPEAPPSTPTVTTAKAAGVAPGADLGALAPSVDLSGFGGAPGGGGGGLAAAAGGSDRGCIPQVRIQPEYPRSARQRRIEGFVDVKFTVGTNGSVKDAVVVRAEPSGVFERAALQAVSSWKYSPQVRDGRAVECVTGVHMPFQLEREG
jgi:protein TonB